METYVISGPLAVEFKKFLQDRIETVMVRRMKDLPGLDKVSVSAIKHTVTTKYLLQGQRLEDHSNQANLVKARGIAAVLMRNICKLSYPQIAQQLGGKHHTTIMHAAQKIRDEINVNPLFSVEFSDLEESLRK